jgi:aldehyde dehydrogenase (NAD+)
VFTRSATRRDEFLERTSAGILKVNRSTADAEIDVPFGGWKDSGVGPAEHGASDLEFFTRVQAIYGE